jgi:oligopeptide/dipeptide ABC transporter ATP-binding protein
MAVLLITHNLGLVAERTQRVYVMYAGQIVESAPTEALFAAPAHPYTQGLMAAVPRLDQPRERLAAIPGQVPPATAWPAGCRFHPRCAFAFDRCRVENPPLLETGVERSARCWLVENDAYRGTGVPAHRGDEAYRRTGVPAHRGEKDAGGGTS